MRFFVFLAACLMPVTVFAAQQKPEMVPCSQIKASPVYSSYGLTVPSGWKCYTAAPKGSDAFQLIVWDKNNQRIAMSEDTLTQKYSKEELTGFPDTNLKEPLRTVRLMVEAFLADKKVINNLVIKGFSDAVIKTPHAILFNPDNKMIAIYGNQGKKEHQGKMQDFQSAMLIKKDGGNKALSVVCYGCSANEFFSLVVNPVIQK
jgi:hypothetical protein